MTDRTARRGRPLLYGLLVLVIAALAIPVSYAFAAGASLSKVTVPVEKYDNGCSYLPKHKIVGSATLTHNKDGSITVAYEIRGATPGDTYYIYLYADTLNGAPVSCGLGTYYAKMKIDSGGDGNKTFTVPASDVSGYNDFWAYSYSNLDSSNTQRSESVHF